MPDFQSLDDIERHYNRQIKAAQDDSDDGRVRELRSELSEKKADFREAQVRVRELAAYKRAALAEYPLAKELEDLVVGDTEEAITANAKRIHERLEARGPQTGGGGGGEPDPREGARQAYGSPAGAGGGTPPTKHKDPNDQFLEDMAAKYNRGEALTFKEAERYERIRGGRRVAEAIGAAGKRWTERDLPWLPENQ